MSLLQTVTVGDRVIDLYIFTGEVVDEKKWSTTSVSSSGGTYNAGTGQNGPVSISSVSTTHDQFFLRDDAGHEMAFEISDAGLAVRKTHRVTVLWGIIKGNSAGPTIAIYNHTTGTLTEIHSTFEKLAVPPRPFAATLVYIIGVFAICFYGVGLIIFGVLYFVRQSRKKELRAALRPAIDSAISQIRNMK